MRLVSFVLATSFSAMPFVGAVAQGTRAGPVFGIYGGWDRTTLHGADVPGPLHITGALGGVFLQWPVTSRFDIQPEVQYVQKGNREFSTTGAGEFVTRLRLEYVEIAVLGRANGPVLAGRYTPFLLAGPEIAFKSKCDVKVFGLSGTFSCDDLGEVESRDYGVIGGGGVDVRVGRRHLALSARYDYGLYEIFEGSDQKNRALSVVLGVPLR